MAIINTVKIKNGDFPDGYIVINECDFDKELHSLFTEAPVKAAEAEVDPKPSTKVDPKPSTKVDASTTGKADRKGRGK